MTSVYHPRLQLLVLALSLSFDILLAAARSSASLVPGARFPRLVLPEPIPATLDARPQPTNAEGEHFIEVLN